jgi:quercetin dioxygenase-like cupin family protein
MHLHPQRVPSPVVSDAADLADWFEPLPGERMSVRIGSRATVGRMAVLESVIAANGSAPLHFHEAADELFIVAEGCLRVSLADRTVEASPGTVIFVPRGTVHGFVNAGTEDVRLLAVFTPGASEAMFREAVTTPPEGLVALAARHGTRIVGAAARD